MSRILDMARGRSPDRSHLDRVEVAPLAFDIAARKAAIDDRRMRRERLARLRPSSRGWIMPAPCSLIP
jgi:hypothetical protein